MTSRNAKAQALVHRSQSASGLIRQPLSKLQAQTKVGSERSREFIHNYLFFSGVHEIAAPSIFCLLFFCGQKNGGAILRTVKTNNRKKVRLSAAMPAKDIRHSFASYEIASSFLIAMTIVKTYGTITAIVGDLSLSFFNLSSAVTIYK